MQIDALNPQWSSSLSLGVTSSPPERCPLPACAAAIKRSAWLLQRRSVFHNAKKVRNGPKTEPRLPRNGKEWPQVTPKG